MNQKKTSKNTIDNTFLIESFFEDTKLIGVICPSAYYTFISQIQQGLGYNFKRNHDYEINYDNQFFPVFDYKDSIRNTEHYLYVNRIRTNYLINENPKIDFIWLMKGSIIRPEMLIQLTSIIRKMNGVINCFEFDSQQFKKRELLII